MTVIVVSPGLLPTATAAPADPVTVTEPGTRTRLPLFSGSLMTTWNAGAVESGRCVTTAV